MEKKIEKAAGYVRVSSAKQVEGESLDTQESQIRKYVGQNEWELTGIYKDAGISGRKASRPDLDRLMADAANRAFDVVLVADLSRFGRSTKDVLNNVERLKQADVKFISIKEKLDGTGPYGQFMLQVFSAIAELESKTIEMRTSENRNSLVEQGKRFIGNLPYGYGRKPKTDKHEPLEIIAIPEEVEIYNKIVELYLDFKMSIETLTVEINNLGYKSKQGKSWNTTSVSDLLKHEAYYLGQITTEVGRIKGKNGKPDTPGKTIVFECPKLISKARWDEIKVKRTSEKIRTGRPSNKSATHLLDKLVYCGICGSKMSSRIEPKTQKEYYSCYWHECTNKSLINNRRTRCPQPRHDAREIEEHVMMTLVQTLFGDPTTLVLTLVEYAEDTGGQGKATRLQAELNGVENRIRNINKALDASNLSPVVLAHHNETLGAALEEKARIVVELDEAKVEVDRKAKEAENIQLLMDFLSQNKERLDEYRDFLMELPFEKKQKFIKGFLKNDKIIITRDDFWEKPDGDDRELIVFDKNHELTQKDLDNVESGFVIDAKFRFNLPILKEMLRDKFNASEGGKSQVKSDHLCAKNLDFRHTMAACRDKSGAF